MTWTSSDPAVATVDTDGNVTAVSNGTATITATSQDGTFTDTCAVTVTAYSDSTGGVIIGGGTPAQPEPKEEESQHLPEQPNTPAVGEGKVKGTVDSKGNATVKITPKSVVDAYEKAMAEAKKNGSEKNGVTVVLRVDTGKKNAGNVSFNLPKTVQDAIIERQIVNFVLMMDDGDISVGIDLNAMKEITKQAKGDVTITATRTNSSKLGSAAKKAIGNRPVYSFKVTYGGGRQVQNFGSGKVTVAIPYALGENQNAGNVQAVYVDAKGKTRYLVRSVFDSARKVLLFSTDTFSTFGVGYRQTNAYEDVADHWAEDDIAFAVSRGLMTGKSKTAFGPDASITRATLVAALGRLADVDVSGYKKSSFGDVKNRSSYMAYIEWAVENGIAQGGGKGKFVPNGTVSREQLAVMLHRYAEAIGFALPKVYEERAFADGEKISEEAAEAVRLLQMAGVISGKSGNLFDPKAKATKAEVAAVLRRFAELLISEEGTQGWTKNDSGQWMYRENGRFVTGEREIDGTTYFFDVYGITER